MGRPSRLAPLVDRVEASDVSRERAKVILETLGGRASVQESLERLRLSRTRFQALRTRFLDAGVKALEGGPVGRPPRRSAEEALEARRLRRRIAELERDLLRAEVRVVLAEAGLLPLLEVRRMVRGGGR